MRPLASLSQSLLFLLLPFPHHHHHQTHTHPPKARGKASEARKRGDRTEAPKSPAPAIAQPLPILPSAPAATMIIKSLKARILRALRSSSLPAGAAADSSPSPPPSPTKPRAFRVAADASSDDASFFDAREADDDTPTTKAEPLDAWELVDDQSDDDGHSSSRADADADAAAAAAADDPDLLLLLGQLPARCPPGGESAVVLYTTTLRGVRRTFEDCNAVRALLENLGAAFQERDVSLDRGLRDQLWAAAGEKAVPPRLFVRGRDAGGAAQVLALHEDGRLAPLLLLGAGGAGARKDAGFGAGKNKCGGCGGLRFVVCGACDGSRKAAGGGGAPCPRCNENGLAVCPLCAVV
ncbi:hypothetical protein U9M48_011764 [Paspalum notatum var. saurae]|uniref:Glutaredoxin domain-containing protein n=1 Tax=Paspalum notatum var. saurae TaxID=547442 RepID=A0AAQ3SY34_PASNO